MYSKMKEEKEVLTHGINQIWDSIVEKQEKEFASREIGSGWRRERS